MRNANLGWLMLAGFLVAASGAAQALAADQGESILEEIVVTAQRQETSLQETAVAVTALSSAALAERNLRSLLDVDSFVPSVSTGVRAGTGTAGGSVAIRGIGVDAQDSSASVGTYIDDVFYASWRGNLLGFLDMERLEVLRGPQGTLFGRNTIAGAIQYVSKAPSDELGGYLKATAGNLDRQDVEGAVNIPFGESLAVRLAAISTDRDGYVKDLFNDVDRGGHESTAARLRVQWTPSERLLVDLKYELVEEETNGRPVLIASVEPRAQFPGLAFIFGENRALSLDSTFLSPDHETFVGYNEEDYWDSKFDVMQASVSYGLTDSMTIKSISAWQEYDSALAQDFDLTPLSILYVTSPNDDIEVFTQELQLTGAAWSDRLNYTLGLYYYDYDQTQAPLNGIQLGFGPTMDPFGTTRLENESWAGYAQVSYDLTNRLAVTLGLRYTDEDIRSTLVGETPPLKLGFSETSPHIGMQFQASDDIMLYAKASEGFRAGGFTANRSLPGGGNPFDPETAWTYEFGARMELLDGRWRLNPTAFFTDWKDTQFNLTVVTGGATAVTTANAGDAEIKGLEIESEFAVTDRLTVTAMLSLLDGEYTRVEHITYSTFPFGFLASFPDPATGQRLPGSVVILPALSESSDLMRLPEAKFAFGISYSHPIGDGAALTTHLNYAWTDKQRSNVMDQSGIEMPSYGLLNARVQFDSADGRWRIAAFGTNLGDEEYLIGGTSFAEGFTSGVTQHDPARPREYGVELTFSF